MWQNNKYPGEKKSQCDLVSFYLLQKFISQINFDKNNFSVMYFSLFLKASIKVAVLVSYILNTVSV